MKKGLFILAGLLILPKLLNRKSMTWDTYTNERLQTLHPKIKQSVEDFINDADKQGIKLRITATGALRSLKTQEDLYAIGRTKPGIIITSSVPGTSYHNYGLAVDVVEIKNGEALWTNPNWDKIGKIGEKHGFEWGGRWTSKQCSNCPDKPHFQKRFGIHHTELLKRVKAGKTTNGYVNI
jgi:peptidoglycan L-alanyl-D-glutamate endopeptidase CwlK